jgi:hypothetical protein
MPVRPSCLADSGGEAAIWPGDPVEFTLMQEPALGPAGARFQHDGRRVGTGDGPGRRVVMAALPLPFSTADPVACRPQARAARADYRVNRRVT